MEDIQFKAFARGRIVDVKSIDFENQYITWFDGQYDRSLPPNKSYEIESFDSIKLMRFTGLFDKNTIPIYEGFICKWPSGHLSYINWDSDRGCFAARAITQQKGVSRWGIAPRIIEVVGNIYENPELLSK